MTVTVGVSLKMYFGQQEARTWFDRVADLLRADTTGARAVRDGEVELFVIPGYLAIASAVEAFAGTHVLIGAQDLASEDSGAFTGEVSPAELAEVGVTVAEVGHAERRRLFGETDRVVAAKTAAALRNGIAPVLCLGELERGTAESAAAFVVAQLRDALRDPLHDAVAGRVIVAYEPLWAIGAAEPAEVGHIVAVARALRAALDALPDRAGSSVVYGGSAGPGLLTRLAGGVDGLFLGRFAHDPAALDAVLTEAAALAATRTAAAASGSEASG